MNSIYKTRGTYFALCVGLYFDNKYLKAFILKLSYQRQVTINNVKVICVGEEEKAKQFSYSSLITLGFSSEFMR